MEPPRAGELLEQAHGGPACARVGRYDREAGHPGAGHDHLLQFGGRYFSDSGANPHAQQPAALLVGGRWGCRSASTSTTGRSSRGCSSFSLERQEGKRHLLGTRWETVAVLARRRYRAKDMFGLAESARR